MRRLVLGSLVAVFALSAVACSVPPGPSSSNVGEQSAPIIKGSPDSGHPNVVALLSPNFSECTGTIISVQGGTGIVLTAAHCVPANDKPNSVRVGSNYNAPTVSYPVMQAFPHPCYKTGNAGSRYDFGLVKFTGANGATPAAMPVLTPAQDTMAAGSSVKFVGFGLISYPNGNNSKKNQVDITVSNAAKWQFGWDGTNGGICQGDSGGPGIFLVGGTEHVAGVSSYGATGCAGWEVAGRVSVVYDDFIKPYIDGTMPSPTCPPAQPALTLQCNNCLTAAQKPAGKCGTQVTTCTNDPQCVAYENESNLCWEDQACYDALKAKYPMGYAESSAFVDCICFGGVCDAVCLTACVGPKVACGVDLNPGACKTCIDTNCCAEGASCYDSGKCRQCEYASVQDPAWNCAADPAVQTYEACVGGKCAAECMFTGSGGAAGAGGSGGSAGAAGGGGSPAGAGGTGPAGAGGTGPAGAGGTGPAGAAGTGQAGTGTAGAGGTGQGGAAGTGTAGAGTAGTGTAGTGTAGAGTAGKGGTGTAGAGTAGAGTAGKAGAGTAGTGTAGTGTAGTGNGGASGSGVDTATQATDSGDSGGCSVAPTRAAAAPSMLPALGILLAGLAGRRRRERR